MYFPPAHPLFVNFTAALLPVSFFSEFLGRIGKRPALQAAAWWMLLWATLFTPLTILFGYRWLRQLGDHGRDITIHAYLGYTLGLYMVAMCLWRGRSYRLARQPHAIYLAILFLGVLAEVVQGHLGAARSFPRDDAAATPTMLLAPTNSHELGNGWKTQIPL